MLCDFMHFAHLNVTVYRNSSVFLVLHRISVIFRVRSAKAVKITDLDLLKRLGIIVTIFSVFLVIRTLVAPPYVIVGRTADDLKAFLCRTDWWDHSFTTREYQSSLLGLRNAVICKYRALVCDSSL
jgi:G protein-coupled receptor 158